VKFAPIKFQGALAAAGVALMPFAYLQFGVPHDKGIIRLSDIAGQGLLRQPLIALLAATMLIFVLIHFALTAVFLKDLIRWLFSGSELRSFLNTTHTNIGLFSPILSLAMTMNVVFGPLVFFFSMSSKSIQPLILPGFIIWGILWLILLLLEGKVIKVWFMQPLEIEKLNFGWLLDVFAFGMISLVGSGIAALADNIRIASPAAFMTLITMAIGFILFVAKIVILLQHQFRADGLPDKPFLPSYFTVVPIVCLYGVSFFKFGSYLSAKLDYDLEVLSFFVVVSSFAISGICILLGTYLLIDYFKKEFFKKEFYPSLWTPVCALVGFEVLGSYVYGNYYQGFGLLLICYVSIILAALLYLHILYRYSAQQVEKSLDS